MTGDGVEDGVERCAFSGIVLSVTAKSDDMSADSEKVWTICRQGRLSNSLGRGYVAWLGSDSKFRI